MKNIHWCHPGRALTPALAGGSAQSRDPYRRKSLWRNGSRIGTTRSASADLVWPSGMTARVIGPPESHIHRGEYYSASVIAPARFPTRYRRRRRASWKLPGRSGSHPAHRSSLDRRAGRLGLHPLRSARRLSCTPALDLGDDDCGLRQPRVPRLAPHNQSPRGGVDRRKRVFRQRPPSSGCLFSLGALAPSGASLRCGREPPAMRSPAGEAPMKLTRRAAIASALAAAATGLG